MYPLPNFNLSGGPMNSKFADALQPPAAEPSRRPVAATRQGRKHVGAYVLPDVARQLRVIAAQEDTSVQALIIEGIERVFQARRG